ncbi:MAG: hypothetical protein GX896_10605 [Clostridiales bacterium]|nr:hypothetical protein [Clostridiales bacterium]
MNSLRFSEACEKIINVKRDKKGIGTLGEKTVHAVLKAYYEPDEDSQEIRIGSYVADIVGEDGIIEIQTRQLGKLKKKLECFLEFTDVTVIYPVPKIKYLTWLDTETGELTKSRKSPAQPDEYSVFRELYPLRKFIKNPRFHFVICFMEVEEIRNLNGWSQNKKRGSTRFDRIPKRIIEEMRFDSAEDYWRFLPIELNENFSSSQYAKMCNIPRDTARLVLNVLTEVGLVYRTGKLANNILFSVRNDE